MAPSDIESSGNEWYSSGFLDACIKASSILVPFLDTIISGNIRPDKTKYTANPKG